MLENLRTGRLTDEPGPEAAEGRVPAIVVDALDRSVFAPARPPRGRFATGLALALAVALHGAVAAALVVQRAEPFGAGGTDLEAISVEVALVPALAKDSLATSEVAMPASRTALDMAEGNANVTSAPTPEAIATAAVTQEPRDNPATEAKATHEVEPHPAAVPPIAREPPSEEPRSADVARLETPPDPSPLEPEAVTLPPARAPSSETVAEPPQARAARVEPLIEPQPASERAPPSEPATEPPPPLPRRKPAERTATSSAASPALQAGGAASRAETSSEHRSRVAAAASPGAVLAYNRSVLAALKKSGVKAPRGHAHGTTVVEFIIAEDGDIDLVRIKKSSGHAALDQAALAAVERASFPPPPPGMTRKQRNYVIPYNFR
jgi:protein TonB